MLDAGCGNGTFLRYIKQKRPEAYLTGIDLAAPDYENGINFIREDMSKVQLERRFDVVVSLAVIEHVTDVRKMIAQMKSWCQPGGQLVVMTLDSAGLLYGAARILRVLGRPFAFNRLYSAHHVHHFTSKSLKRLMHESGVTVIEMKHCNFPMAAVDIPESSLFSKTLYLAAVAGIFLLGWCLRRTCLQTMMVITPEGE